MIEVYDTNENVVVGYNMSGVIKKYSESSELQYPFIVIGCDKIEKYKVETIKALLCFDSEDPIYVYLTMMEKMINIGKIDRKKLRTLLDTKVLEGMNKEIHISSDDVLEGDMMYAMCK